MYEFKNGLTVKQLKELIKDWPEETATGEPTEVWVSTSDNQSSPVVDIWNLNFRKQGDQEWSDILLQSQSV